MQCIIPTDEDNLPPLTDKQIEVVILRMKGYNYDQISRTLGIRHQAIQERMQAARKRLGIKYRGYRHDRNDLAEAIAPYLSRLTWKQWKAVKE